MTTKDTFFQDIETRGVAMGWPLASTRIRVPKVRLEARDLLWTFALTGEEREPDRRILEDFMSLGGPRGSDEAVLRFAERWGILGTCEHGFPGYHFREEPRDDRRVLTRCIPPTGWALEGREPVDDWLRISGGLRALMRLGSAILQKEPSQAGDWSMAFDLAGTQMPPGTELHSSPGRQYHFKRLLDLLMTMGNVRPMLVLEEGKAEMKLGGSGLFGALVLRVALSLTKAEGLFLCSSCAEPYTRDRRPPHGTHNLCQECGPRAGNALRASAHRQRKADIVKMYYLEHLSVPAISVRTGRDPEQIRKWIAERPGRRQWPRIHGRGRLEVDPSPSPWGRPERG